MKIDKHCQCVFMYLRKSPLLIFSLLGVSLILSTVYFFYPKNPSLESLEASVQNILPKKTTIKKIEKMEGGFSNDIWQIYTEDKRYILREKSRKTKTASFIKDLEIAKKASFYRMGPEIIGVNIRKQQLLIEYIDHIPWPSYEDNSEPYKKTMQALRAFHEKMPSAIPFYKTAVYSPFEYIFRVGKKLEQGGITPSQFSLGLKRVKKIFRQIKPWIKKHATLCHGDFCKQNVLLSKNFQPILIDFDSASIGDPIFDVVKFSLSLFPQERQELFRVYLGNREPSFEEQSHFQMLDLTLLMLIATIRFNSSQAEGLKPAFSQKEMDLILESNDHLPSFLDVPFEDSSPKTKQLGALYALAEFLKKTADFN